MLACPDGLPVAWCLAAPSRGEREVAEGLLDRAARQHILRPAILDTLKDQLSLEGHGAHTIHGLWVRVAQRLFALASGIWFNWQLGVPSSARWSPTTTNPSHQSTSLI